MQRRAESRHRHWPPLADLPEHELARRVAGKSHREEPCGAGDCGAEEMISAIEQQPAGSSIDLVKQVEEIFSPSGVLSRASNFEYRPQQQQMAVAVARALESREHLCVEAGTGVGKSLAYLVPAILFAKANNKKAVISTHTINLQEQLTQKDL